MKKRFYFVLMLTAVSLAACTGKGGAAGMYTAGTYSASAQGFGGEVTVTITTDESSIKEVKITGDKETENIGKAAIPALEKSAMDKQSEEIDAVAGATVTSSAVKTALAQAISEAKGSAAAGDDELKFTAGTYTGKGAGYNGSVEVSVTFSENAIESIEVSSDNETEHVGDIVYDILIKDMLEANGTGVDGVSGATFSSRALKEAVNDAAKQAGVTNEAKFASNTVKHSAESAIENTWDVVVIGAGGAGVAAAAQAAQDGNTVLILEKNAEIGGNTLVSGGQYQSVMPYLVWDAADPDAAAGVGFDGKTYNKVKSVQGCIDELKVIADWSEEPFDEEFYKTNEYVAGDIRELSKHGVHTDYLPVLQELKSEINAYLAWAQPKLDAGVPEAQLTLFSTLNLHIFQTYYGGLRQTSDKSQWIYGNVDLVKQFINEGQDIKPWLESMGSTFVEDTQPTLIGALWYRENQFIGANVDTDGDGTAEEIGGRWGTYFMAPMTAFYNANEANELMTRTAATELIVENGKVTGVKAVRYDGTEVTAHANKGVVIATGGYAANIPMVVETNKYWSPDLLTESIKTTNRSALVGEGMDMAQAAGAALTGEGFTQLMPISWIDNGNLAFGGGDYAIYINPKTGKRYVDETSERDVLSLAGFENGIDFAGANGVFIEIANAATPIPGPYPYKEEDVVNRQYIRTIDELDALFKEIGLDTDAAVVRATIESYDKAILNGSQPEDAGKKQASTTIGNVEKNADGTYNTDSYKLEGAKLRVRLLAPSTHHTMGGILVDEGRHVLDKDNQVISGLYAAGEVTGGIHGGNRLGGNAITEIIVSGRIAAKTINEDNK